MVKQKPTRTSGAGWRKGNAEHQANVGENVVAKAIKNIRRRLGKLVGQKLTQNARRVLEKMVWRKPAQKRRRLEKLVRQADAERGT